jgi:hypothetical protein
MKVSLTSLMPRPDDPPQGEVEYVEGSGALFSMFLTLAGEQDKNMTENWKGDADSILVFVSRHSTCATSIQIEPEPEDWFILCRCRNVSFGIRR